VHALRLRLTADLGKVRRMRWPGRVGIFSARHLHYNCAIENCSGALETSLYATILVLIMGSVVRVVVKPACITDLMVGIFSCRIRVRINSVRVRRLWGR
jgi:hypothetical protein